MCFNDKTHFPYEIIFIVVVFLLLGLPIEADFLTEKAFYILLLPSVLRGLIFVGGVLLCSSIVYLWTWLIKDKIKNNELFQELSQELNRISSVIVLLFFGVIVFIIIAVIITLIYDFMMILLKGEEGAYFLTGFGMVLAVVITRIIMVMVKMRREKIKKGLFGRKGGKV